ncbi:MAG: DEAD/DEAH box helicase [Spirochaetes bacterium]|nr:DEAD/DEAH box helicase [Spirochaetota bacterium]
MNIRQLIEFLQNDNKFLSNVRLWMKKSPRDGLYEEWPVWIDERVKSAYVARGIEKLYVHQKIACEAIAKAEDIVVVTPTASGKTLCYNIPVLDAMAKNPDARALYLFPTKALSQDQLSELSDAIERIGISIKTYTFDGDTPASARKAIRSAGNIVITNPDMLHSGILPHHTIWIKLFENLKFVVIDELHSYRGVFGSHLANVVRRLLRLCTFYGSKPQFICCSATIQNPKEHADAIIGRPVTLIDKNGAPCGEKHYVIYNPPVINEDLGIRASAIKEAVKIGEMIIKNRIPTIIFARSRLRVEIVSTYLRERCGDIPVVAYRGGYLPNERRAIEKGLREGRITGVVSTNALELGIDIGMLDVAISVGYPGSISSMFQQFGRAGRRGEPSLAILVATSSPLDQFICNNTDFFVNANPESATINPDNLLILMDHIKCSSFELPFKENERFAPHLATTREMLEYLESEGVLKRSDGKFHWMSDIYPANEISLRTASQENFVIIDTKDKNKVIGEVDYYSAPTDIHDDAIYIHQGRQYYIDKLDWERRMAYCHEVESDYYTDAETKTNVSVLERFQSRAMKDAELSFGEVNVRSMAVMFKKIKFNTHENLGWGRIHLPELEMHTEAMWIDFNDEVLEQQFGRQMIGRILYSVAYILRHIAPIFTLSESNDIRVHHETRSLYSGKPAVFLYDALPGGVGISKRVFDTMEIIIEEAIKSVKGCACMYGCPSCIGPLPDEGKDTKVAVVQLLQRML